MPPNDDVCPECLRREQKISTLREALADLQEEYHQARVAWQRERADLTDRPFAIIHPSAFSLQP